MGQYSKIEWTDASWNPVTGCSRVSPGCKNCYAESLSRRWKWTTRPWTHRNAAENVQLHPERLENPLHWKRPRRIFVNSMSDLFHSRVPDDFIAKVFRTMHLASQHQFQILTKRPARMRNWFEQAKGPTYLNLLLLDEGSEYAPRVLPNVWLGTSVEDQRRADERIPALMGCPAAVRFLSCEPLLGPIDLGLDRIEHAPYPNVTEYAGPYLWHGTDCTEIAPTGTVKRPIGKLHCEGRWAAESYHYPIGWVIVGGESGPGARATELDWVEDLVDQCRRAQVPVFVKQLGSQWARDNGSGDRKGGQPDDWPSRLAIREYPAKKTA